jgi:hypothetical protein
MLGFVLTLAAKIIPYSNSPIIKLSYDIKIIERNWKKTALKRWQGLL